MTERHVPVLFLDLDGTACWGKTNSVQMSGLLLRPADRRRPGTPGA